MVGWRSNKKRRACCQAEIHISKKGIHRWKFRKDFVAFWEIKAEARFRQQALTEITQLFRGSRFAAGTAPLPIQLSSTFKCKIFGVTESVIFFNVFFYVRKWLIFLIAARFKV
ncbi:hypothetical protein CEXT_746981 [Caerostris extrusa]|uniref:Uncharacterized protein n=1 Tax=Caerostris extrusa TaxID=172846 RepID=A0AAV4M3H7_CAEEX|nr:hypothetical protein CEXT_746981 [Caerostris extrusa]